MTNGKQQDANAAYAAANGKYGQNWIASGSTLAPGDFVGSTSGNLALIMQTDGNLVLYTFQNVLNCQKMSDGNTGGGQNANALYNIGEVGIPGNLGKIAYVDQNSELYSYPATNKQFTNSYTTFLLESIFASRFCMRNKSILFIFFILPPPVVCMLVTPYFFMVF